MYNSSQPGPTDCDNCGALLPKPDEQGHRTCSYCGATYTAPASQTPQQPQVNIVLGTTTFPDVSDFQPINPDAAKKAAGCGMSVVIFIILITVASVGIPLYFAFKDSGSFGDLFGGLTGTSAPDTTPSYAFLPAEPAGPAPYVLLTSGYDSGKGAVVHHVIKVDGKDQKAAWTSPDLGSTDQERPLLSDGTRLLLPDGRRIVALNLSDGTLAWQAPLSDEFRGWRMARDCPGCFALNGTAVSAVTSDGVLATFDTTNGQSLWTRRLVDVNARVWSVGGVLAVFDGESTDRKLFVLDPATGAELHALSPTCVEPGDTPNFSNTLSSTFQVSPVPGAAALDLAFGSSPSCVQRWDLTTGAQTANVLIGQSFSFGDDSLLSMGTTTFAGGNQGYVLADMTTGAAVPVAGEEGWEYRPLGLAGGRVATVGKSSRGTTKYTVVFFDAATGAKTGESPLGASQPGAGFWGASNTSADEKSDFFLPAVSGDKVVIVQLRGETKLEVSAVDPATAVSTVLGTNDVKTSDIIPNYGPAVWGGTKALVRFGDDNLWTVDLTTGKITFDYP